MNDTVQYTTHTATLCADDRGDTDSAPVKAVSLPPLCLQNYQDVMAERKMEIFKQP